MKKFVSFVVLAALCCGCGSAQVVKPPVAGGTSDQSGNRPATDPAGVGGASNPPASTGSSSSGGPARLEPAPKARTAKEVAAAIEALGEKRTKLVDGRVVLVNLGDLLTTDEDIAELAVLTDLEILLLQNTRVTDAGLSLLKFAKLRKLSLAGTAITDAGLENLQGLPELRELDLYSTPVTDAGLPHLEKLPALEVVKLNGTRVTDAGLETLPRLRALKQVWLYGSGVTPEGVARFKQSNPTVRVVFPTSAASGGSAAP